MYTYKNTLDYSSPCASCRKPKNISGLLLLKGDGRKTNDPIK